MLGSAAATLRVYPAMPKATPLADAVRAVISRADEAPSRLNAMAVTFDPGREVITILLNTGFEISVSPATLPDWRASQLRCSLRSPLASLVWRYGSPTDLTCRSQQSSKGSSAAELGCRH